MGTRVTRRELAQLAGSAAIVMSARPRRRGGADPTGAMQRADELLRKMTIEEKTMQLSSVFPLALFNTEGTNRSQLDALLKNGIGHVSAPGLINSVSRLEHTTWVGGPNVGTAVAMTHTGRSPVFMPVG